MRFPSVNDCQSVPELIHFRATLHPTRVAAVFVDDAGLASQLTYGQLWEKSLAVAAHLIELAPDAGLGQPVESPRAVLVHPPGLEFLSAFIGSQLAGWIPVPTSYPKPFREMPRVDAVSRNCSPTAILSTRQTIETIDRRKLTPAAASLPLIACDEAPPVLGDIDWQRRSSSSSISLLQYTSGSTSEPKGVIVSQRNVMANLKAIGKAFHLECDESAEEDCVTAVSWLPFFHDMGLIGGVLAPIFNGYRCIFMSPQSFIQRPIRWFQLISQYQASVSGGPNFAYELCADRIAPNQVETLDLRSWRVAFCGAEPIRAQTLHSFSQRFSSLGFRDSSFLPCYGLAEATLLAAGTDGPRRPHVAKLNRQALRELRVESLDDPATRRPKQGDIRKANEVALVSCGSPGLDMQLKIVDPNSLEELGEKQIGEIWLEGPSVTAGYWNRPEENEARFGTIKASSKAAGLPRWFRKAVKANNVGVASEQSSTPRYLRTGDLGYMHEGQLFVTGRIKDIIIVRGRNYAPQDIELSAASVGLPIQGKVVAVSIDGPRAESLAIIAEISRDASPQCYLSLVRDIRRMIINDHEIDPRVVLLVRPGTVPVTTSGKVQRSECQKRLLAGTFEPRFRWERSGGAESPPLPIPELPVVVGPDDREEIESHVRGWLQAWLVARAGIDPSEIAPDRQFDEYGLDSLTAVELSGELEDWSGVELTPTNAWEHPSIDSMAKLITDGLLHTANDLDTPQGESEMQIPSGTVRGL